MRDGADSTLIEIIDSDPSAFAGTGMAPAVRTRAELPRWLIPTAVGSVLAIAVVALLVWKPWRQEPETPWSNRLLLNAPTSSVIDVLIDQPWLGGSAADVGYVFAEAGAVLPYLHGGEGRSATWNSAAADSVYAAYGSMTGYTPVVQVQGAPARVNGVDGSTVNVTFGPLDGRVYVVSTNGMSKDEAVRFAGSIAVERGRPVLRDDSVLMGMQPIGSYDDFNAALTLLNLGGGPTTATFTSVRFVRPQGGISSVASLPDNGDGTLLEMAQLIVGSDAAATVHGRPALAENVRGATNNDQQAVSVVAWHERGRFIVVSGSGDVEETLVLAATTREVGNEEWTSVADQAYPTESHYPAFIGFRVDANGSVVAVSARADELSGLSLCLDDQSGGDAGCAIERDIASPLLTLMHIDSLSFIVAMVKPEDLLPELHVIHTDGTVDVHILFLPSASLPGPAVAVFLPDDFQEATLVVDGTTVVALPGR